MEIKTEIVLKFVNLEQQREYESVILKMIRRDVRHGLLKDYESVTY